VYWVYVAVWVIGAVSVGHADTGKR
jgi:hypothetical protein